MKRYIVDSGSHTGIITLSDDAEFHGNDIWDEEVDGEIPASVLPDIKWLKRVGDTLKVDTILKAVVQAADTAKTNKENARAALAANLRAYDGTTNTEQTLLDLLNYRGFK